MALRDQPYIPLYVQDIMTDERLNECSAATHGIYIKGIMCLMHKSKEYGVILLKQKYKQTESKSKNFAICLVKHLPYTVDEIQKAIDELIEEDVLLFGDDKLIQPRMVKDNKLSIIRAEAGKKGGKSSFFALAKQQANPENENEVENDINKKEEFLNFYDTYHAVTKLPKTDKQPAYKHWKKLTKAERDLALDNIALYYRALPDNGNGKYVKKARTYLADKNFNDEFHQPQPENDRPVN